MKQIVLRSLILCGCILLAVASLEIALRTASVLMRSVAPARGSAGTVLCLGDSFTFGTGAPANASYPLQLQALLNTARPGRYTVINEGIPGNNTTQIYDRLAAILGSSRPAWAVVLMGCNNDWNRAGYSAAMHDVSVRGRLADAIRASKVFKLAKIMTVNAQAGIARLTGEGVREQNPVRAYRGADSRPPAELFSRNVPTPARTAALRERIRRNAGDIQACYFLQDIYRKTSRFKEAAEMSQRIIAIDPSQPFGYILLGHDRMDLGQWRAAYDALRTSLAIERDSYACSMIIDLHSKCRQGDPALAQKIIDVLLETRPFCGPANQAVIDTYVSTGRDQDQAHTIDAWIAADTARIIELCRAQGVKIVFMSYPRGGNSWEKIRATCVSAQVPLVDNAPSFDRLLADHPRRDYLVPDGHCTAAGYAVIARNVRDTILSTDNDAVRR